MRLRLPADQTARLREALAEAGQREIGGQIFGEQLAPSDFRATELTIQKRHGTVIQFIVDLVQATRDALQFHARTQHQYARFNYIGEWHSHPLFEVRPSGTDVAAMHSIVRARQFRGHFALLMIVRLRNERFDCGAWLFEPKGRETDVALELES